MFGVKTKVACYEVGVAGAQVRSLINRLRIVADEGYSLRDKKGVKENSLRARNFPCKHQAALRRRAREAWLVVDIVPGQSIR